MTEHNTKPERCNPTMELAISAARFPHEKTTKCILNAPPAQTTREPVTVDYLQGFHSGS